MDYDDAIAQLKANGIQRLLALTGVNTIAKLRDYWQDCECWFRILNEEGGFALKYCCELRPDEAIEGQTPPEHFAEFIAEGKH